MPDTVRSTTALLTQLFQDGQADGSITPQDFRDLILSLDYRTPFAVADDTARLARFPTPTGGELCYNVAAGTWQYYSGSAWLSTTADPTKVPTLEELETRALLPTAISATSTIYLGSTNFNQRVGALTVSFSGAIAKSDVDYWTIELQRIRNGGTPVRLTALTTQNTGGVAIAANTALNFDSAIWPASLRYVIKGDVFRIVLTKTGAPANLTDGVVVMRYEPDVIALCRDTFTRADSTTSMGSTEDATPRPWQIIQMPTGTNNAVFGIKTGGLAIITPTTVRCYAGVDVGVTDCSVSATIADPTGHSLAMCISSGSPLSDPTKFPNGYLHTQAAIFRSDNGTLTQLALISPNLAAGDWVTFERTQGVFRIYKNGVLAATTGVDNTYQSTVHGVRYSSGTNNAPLWDEFTVAV